MVSLGSIERLNDRVAEYLGTDRPRMGGVIVRTPKLADGSVELHCGNVVLAMSLEQIARLRERFPLECGGPSTNLPISPHRIPMTDDWFSDYCALIQRRIEDQRPVQWIK